MVNKFTIVTILFFIVMRSGVYFFHCDHKYETAISYIKVDSDFSDMVAEFRPYGIELLYDEEKKYLYKTSQTTYNEIFEIFDNELREIIGEGVYEDSIQTTFFRKTSEKSCLGKFTVNDTANVRLFFSEPFENVLAAEVFFVSSDSSTETDTYRATLMGNVGLGYLFVFENGEIDTVYKKITQYN